MSGHGGEARFRKEEVEKDDGRYIIFYTFGEEDRREGDKETMNQGNSENRNGTGPSR